jgi:hypothetical protein
VAQFAASPPVTIVPLALGLATASAPTAPRAHSAEPLTDPPRRTHRRRREHGLKTWPVRDRPSTVEARHDGLDDQSRASGLPFHAQQRRCSLDAGRHELLQLWKRGSDRFASAFHAGQRRASRLPDAPSRYRFRLWLSHKSKTLEKSPNKDGLRDGDRSATRRINLGGTPVLGQTDNERPSSPTCATATPGCGRLRRRPSASARSWHGCRTS